MAHRARAGPGEPVDRRRCRRGLRRLRRRRRLDRQLRRRPRHPRRPRDLQGHGPRSHRRRAGAGGRCRFGLGQHGRCHRGGHPAGGCVRSARVRRQVARRADRLRPAAAGRAGSARAGHGGCHSPRPLRARLQSWPLQRRLPLMRRLDQADRQLGEPPLRRQRQLLRLGRQAGGDDRPLQLVLRRGRNPDPQPREGRAAGDDQLHEHGRRSDASRQHARRGHPQRAGRLLPDRRAQLHASRRHRRP